MDISYNSFYDYSKPYYFNILIFLVLEKFLGKSVLLSKSLKYSTVSKKLLVVILTSS